MSSITIIIYYLTIICYKLSSTSFGACPFVYFFNFLEKANDFK